MVDEQIAALRTWWREAVGQLNSNSSVQETKHENAHTLVLILIVKVTDLLSVSGACSL